MSDTREHLFDLGSLREPYRIKMVEKARLPSREERARALEEAHYYVVHLNAEDVYVDLMTDSGTGAMSDQQWAALMKGDEAYMRSHSFWEVVKAVRDILGYPNVVPTHQGRAAEHILMEVLGIQADQYVVSNTHFDTTRAHVKRRGATPLDFVKESVFSSFDDDSDKFKGNFDLQRLKDFLEKQHAKVACVIITVLNNFACSTPVSMENIREVSQLARAKGKPVFFDACRFAENAYFIQQHEPGYKDKTIREIAREMMRYGDGCWMSAKKDAIVNIGGFLALNDRELARKCQERLVLYEGFPSYGGLAGRDLEAMAVGLYEGIDQAHLEQRTQQVAYLAERMEKAGIRVSKPAGGSGVFVDLLSLYGYMDEKVFPAVAFTNDLYLEGGVRVGAYPFTYNAVENGVLKEKVFQFARFAIPRRTYTQSHLDYVAAAMAEVKKLTANKEKRSKGYVCVYAPPVLPNFFSKFRPIEKTDALLLRQKAAAAVSSAKAAAEAAKEALRQATEAVKATDDAVTEAAKAAGAAEAAAEAAARAQEAQADSAAQKTLRTKSKEAAQEALKAYKDAMAQATDASVKAKSAKEAWAGCEAAKTAAIAKIAALPEVTARILAAVEKAEADEGDGGGQ
jgi:tryptophanase